MTRENMHDYFPNCVFTYIITYVALEGSAKKIYFHLNHSLG